MVPLIQLPPARIHCRVRLAKGRGRRVLARAGPFRNLVVVNGLNNLAGATFDALVNYCHCGTGSQAVALGDAGLEAFFASSNSIIEATGANQGLPPYYSEFVQTWRFPAGTFNGQQIAEVGFSSQATNGGLFSRALVEIPDEFRDPTVLLIRSDEWLDVTYEFRLYPSHVASDGGLADGSGVIEINGAEYAYTIRPANVTNNDYWNAQNATASFVAVASAYAKPYGAGSVLGAVTNEPTAPSGAVAYTPDSAIFGTGYTPGSFSRELLLLIGPGDCNASGGVRSLRFHTGLGAYQMRFDPVVPKSGGNSWNFVLALAWANAEL